MQEAMSAPQLCKGIRGIYGAILCGESKKRRNNPIAVSERFYSGGILRVVRGDADFSRGLVCFSGVMSRERR